jgi:hypothetical protein
MERGKSSETDLVDFIPHPPTRLDAYARLEKPVEMKFGSFYFHVGKEGSYRSSEPIRSRSSETTSRTSTTEFSSSETSSTSSIKPTAREDLANLFGGMSFESYTDSDLDSKPKSFDSLSFIDKSTSLREAFINRYDSIAHPGEKQSQSIYHQVCVIGESSRQDETSEAFDDLGNPYIDPADLTRGLGTKYIGTTPRQKLQLPQTAWDRATAALNGTRPMTTAATVEELQAYQYRLARANRELEKQREILEK